MSQYYSEVILNVTLKVLRIFTSSFCQESYVRIELGDATIGPSKNSTTFYVISAFYDRRKNLAEEEKINIRAILLLSFEPPYRKAYDMACISNGISSRAYLEELGMMVGFKHKNRFYHQFLLNCQINQTKIGFFQVSTRP